MSSSLTPRRKLGRFPYLVLMNLLPRHGGWAAAKA